MGVRCPSLADDPSTPSGLTQCMDDDGHDGPHFHTNGYRSVVWQEGGLIRLESK